MSERRVVLGVDPGVTGAAVWWVVEVGAPVAEARVVAAAEWHPRRGRVEGWRLRSWWWREGVEAAPTVADRADLHGVGSWVAAATFAVVARELGEGDAPGARASKPGGVGVAVGVEALFVGGLPGAAQAAIRLGEATGELLGPLRGVADGPIERRLASQWRRRALGMQGRIVSADAHAAALERWGPLLGPLGGVVHACEAAGIGLDAAYGRGYIGREVGR